MKQKAFQYLLCAMALSVNASVALAGPRGLTWEVIGRSEVYGYELDSVGCHNATSTGCNPYEGDYDTAESLPVLCLQKDPNLPDPRSAYSPLSGSYFYDGYVGGKLALSLPVQGSLITSQSFGLLSGDNICNAAFGDGWRMAEFHDGGGGWNFRGYGHLDATSRFWVAIDDQPANAWNSQPGLAPIYPARQPTVLSVPPPLSYLGPYDIPSPGPLPSGNGNPPTPTPTLPGISDTQIICVGCVQKQRKDPNFGYFAVDTKTQAGTTSPIYGVDASGWIRAVPGTLVRVTLTVSNILGVPNCTSTVGTWSLRLAAPWTYNSTGGPGDALSVSMGFPDCYYTTQESVIQDGTFVMSLDGIAYFDLTGVDATAHLEVR